MTNHIETAQDIKSITLQIDGMNCSCEANL